MEKMKGYRIGNYDIFQVNFDNFALDGGAMFGSVPKNLWEKKIKPNHENQIPLASKSLLLLSKTQRVLIDCGIGDSLDEKQKKIFKLDKINDCAEIVKRFDINTIILSHLHFDHAGGLINLHQSIKDLKNIKVFVQKDNYIRAKNPGLREKASYLKSFVDILENFDLQIVNGKEEILENIEVFPLYGHTSGMQCIRIYDENKEVFFTSDLIPTLHHIQIPYVMGYDLWAEKSMEEKREFLFSKVGQNSFVFFQHDRDVAAASFTISEKKNIEIKDIIEIPKI